MMQEDTSVGWDPVSIPPHISTILRIYVLFLLVTVIVTIVKLIALWISAPPFRLSRQMNNPDYLQRLRTERSSIQQWMICTLLGWAFVASSDLYQISNRLLEAKVQNATSLLWAFRDFSVSPKIASFVALFLFLAQWHLLSRIERHRSGVVPKSSFGP